MCFNINLKTLTFRFIHYFFKWHPNLSWYVRIKHLYTTNSSFMIEVLSSNVPEQYRIRLKDPRELCDRYVDFAFTTVMRKESKTLFKFFCKSCFVRFVVNLEFDFVTLSLFVLKQNWNLNQQDGAPALHQTFKPLWNSTLSEVHGE